MGFDSPLAGFFMANGPTNPQSEDELALAIKRKQTQDALDRARNGYAVTGTGEEPDQATIDMAKKASIPPQPLMGGLEAKISAAPTPPIQQTPPSPRMLGNQQPEPFQGSTLQKNWEKSGIGTLVGGAISALKEAPGVIGDAFKTAASAADPLGYGLNQQLKSYEAARAISGNRAKPGTSTLAQVPTTDNAAASRPTPPSKSATPVADMSNLAQVRNVSSQNDEDNVGAGVPSRPGVAPAADPHDDRSFVGPTNREMGLYTNQDLAKYHDPSRPDTINWQDESNTTDTAVRLRMEAAREKGIMASLNNAPSFLEQQKRLNDANIERLQATSNLSREQAKQYDTSYLADKEAAAVATLMKNFGYGSQEEYVGRAAQEAQTTAQSQWAAIQQAAQAGDQQAAGAIRMFGGDANKFAAFRIKQARDRAQTDYANKAFEIYSKHQRTISPYSMMLQNQTGLPQG